MLRFKGFCLQLLVKTSRKTTERHLSYGITGERALQPSPCSGRLVLDLLPDKLKAELAFMIKRSFASQNNKPRCNKRVFYVFIFSTFLYLFSVLRATACNAIARICHRNSVCPFVCMSVCQSHGWISQKGFCFCC